MFARVSTFILSTFAVLAVATPGGWPTTSSTEHTVTTTVTVTATAPATTTEPASQCNTGPVQCCNSVQRADSSEASTLLGLLNIVVQGASVPIGISCTPISVLGVGGNSCNAQPVCCENNNFNGLVAIGCVPITINA